MKKTNEILKTELLIPKGDFSRDSEIELSILVPALNEEITIGEFVDWCFEGIRKAGISAEIIIIDSSSDETPRIALSKGARVLRTPKRGLGHAYIDAIPYIRGKFIIMGDCDLTYDFREIKPFVDSYKSGNEFVMGSRFSGSIEDGAMPPLHRYFGTPLTTWILNRIYHSKYSDIHCGMRGITKDALEAINLSSRGWEYASEMVLKASRIGLKIDEVPVKFYKDREGRFSHHRRAGFWSPWYAGWINLKVMLVYSPDTFLIKPGIFLILFGLTLSFFSYSGNFSLGRLGLGETSFVLGGTSVILGYSLFQLGILARQSHELRQGLEQLFIKKFTYEKGMLTSFMILCLGIYIDTDFLIDFISKGYEVDKSINYPILGMNSIIFAVQTFSFTLLLDLKRRLKFGRAS